MKTKKETKTFKSAKLVVYKGGGYDGCFWEPNFALLVDNVFHDIGSSGYRAIKSKDKLLQVIKDDISSKSYNVDIYNLNKKDDLKSIAGNIHENYIGSVVGKVNEVLNMHLLYFKCSYCGEQHSFTESEHENYPQWFFDENNYSGNGGIGINWGAVLCESCYLNRCNQCDVIFSPDDEQHEYDGESLCKYCYEEKTREDDRQDLYIEENKK